MKLSIGTGGTLHDTIASHSL